MKFGSAKQRFDISTCRYMADTLKHLVSVQITVEAFEEKPGEEFKKRKTYTHRVCLGCRTLMFPFVRIKYDRVGKCSSSVYVATQFWT